MCRGRAMHRQQPLLGHEIVHNGEHALFHFTGVLRAKNDHLLSFKIEVDTRGRGHTVGVPIGRKLAGVENDIIGFKVCQLFGRRSNQHGVDEQGVIGASTDDANLDLVLRILSSKGVNTIELVSRVEIVDGSLAVN